VRDTVELRPDGGVDLGPAMAEQIAPQRGDAVEVSRAVGVDQIVALAGHHH